MCTGLGATGEWIVDCPELDGSLSWTSSSNGGVPSNAIEGGADTNGKKMFVARARYEGDLVDFSFLFLIISKKQC